MITKLALTKDQVYAIAAAIDIALDDIHETQQNYPDHQPNYCSETAQHLEALSAIINEKILALDN